MTQIQATKGARDAPPARVPAIMTAGSVIATALSLIGGVCWTLLVGAVGYVLGMLVYLSAGGVIGDSNQAQSYMDTGQAIWVAAAVLALAPWLAVGILIAAIWAPNIWAIDTWRKTKRAKSARDSEGAA